MKNFLFVYFALVLSVFGQTDYAPASSKPSATDSDRDSLKKINLLQYNASLGATGGATVVSSAAYEASHVIKASAGTLISLSGYNSKGSAQFIQVYNTAAVPADAAVPIFTFTVAASSNFSLQIPVTGAPFTTGICVANSSTGPAKTIGSADCFFTVIIK